MVKKRATNMRAVILLYYSILFFSPLFASLSVVCLLFFFFRFRIRFFLFLFVCVCVHRIPLLTSRCVSIYDEDRYRFFFTFLFFLFLSSSQSLKLLMPITVMLQSLGGILPPASPLLFLFFVSVLLCAYASGYVDRVDGEDEMQERKALTAACRIPFKKKARSSTRIKRKSPLRCLLSFYPFWFALASRNSASHFSASLFYSGLRKRKASRHTDTNTHTHTHTDTQTDTGREANAKENGS